MSPEIIINGRSVVDLPDRSGVYDTPIGRIEMDMSQIAPGNKVQQLSLKGDALKGRVGGKTEDGKRLIQIKSNHQSASITLGPTKKLKVVLNHPIRSTGQWGRVLGHYYPDYPEESTKIQEDKQPRPARLLQPTQEEEYPKGSTPLY